MSMVSSPIPDDSKSPIFTSRLASNQQNQQSTRFYGTEYLREKSTVNKHDRDSNSANTTDNMIQKHNTGAGYSPKNNIINTRKYFREVYGPFLCSLLLISVFLVILGSALMLAGFYVPAIQLEQLDRTGGKEDMNKILEIEKAQTHNEALGGMRVSGVALLSIGVIGLTILFLTPIVCLRRTEYALLPPSALDDVLPRSSFSSAASGLPDDMFTFSVVKQHIQPKKQAISGVHGKTRNSRSLKRSNYDKGFLSPELNRGPIFVSDENFRIHNNNPDVNSGKNRYRSSSFDSRLSPRNSAQRNTRHSLCGTLTPDYTRRSGPTKAGSFHSLHH